MCTNNIEFSIVKLSELDAIKKRLDSEYYQRHYIALVKKINAIGQDTLASLKADLDCSAFYPSITEYYNFEFKGVPFLRVNEIQNGIISISSNTAFLPQEVLDNNPSTIALAYPFDIVIAKGGNTLAKLGLVTDEYPYYALSRDLILLRTHKLIVNKYFLWVFLHSKYGQDLLWRTASQTGQPHLTLPSILEIGIPKYSQTFQNKFEFLYLESVKLKNQSNQRLKESELMLLEKLGLKKWKSNIENISIRKLSNSFSISGRLDAEYYQPKYYEILEVISKVKHKSLGSIVNFKKSIEPGSDAYQMDGIPFIRVSDISKFGLSEPEIHLESGIYNDDNLKPKKDTILLSKDGSVGIAYKVENDLEVITSSALLHLSITDKEVLPDYLTLVLNSKLTQLQAERDAGGSIIQHWRVDEIKQVLIPILPIVIQKELVKQVQNSFKLRRESNKLIVLAKEAVEIAIENDENVAMKFIKDNN